MDIEGMVVKPAFVIVIFFILMHRRSCVLEGRWFVVVVVLHVRRPLSRFFHVQVLLETFQTLTLFDVRTFRLHLPGNQYFRRP